ncbi:MAG: hypothetical protein WBM44_21360 [Waterburya sp.]
MNKDKELQVIVLNSSFYKGEVDFDGLLPSCDDYPILHQILSEYSALIKQSDISEQDADRISAILELAERDRILDECIDKIDKASQVQSEIQCTKLPIEEFLIELIRLSSKQLPQDAFMKSFRKLVKRININTELINSTVKFNDSAYNTSEVFSNSKFSMYVNSWNPRQYTRTHQNFRYSTETLVYRGRARKTVFKRIDENGTKIDKLVYSKDYCEGEWISTNQNEIHQLANFSSEKLITIHFKYFNIDPNDRDINDDDSSAIPTNFDIKSTLEQSEKPKSEVIKKGKGILDKFLEVTH